MYEIFCYRIKPSYLHTEVTTHNMNRRRECIRLGEVTYGACFLFLREFYYRLDRKQKERLSPAMPELTNLFDQCYDDRVIPGYPPEIYAGWALMLTLYFKNNSLYVSLCNDVFEELRNRYERT